MMRLLGWLAATLLWCGSAGAQAQAESPKAPTVSATPSPTVAAPTTPPDVVVLKNGSRYRGTIAELVKDGPVTIVLITGETRRLEAADIAYAGPSDSEPRAQATDTATPDDSAQNGKSASEDSEEDAPTLARARFSSNKRHTEFLYRTARGFKRICAAPCKHDFQPDIYTIGVRFSPSAGATRLRDVMIDRPMSLDLEYRSRAKLRNAGAVVAVISAIALGSAAAYGLLADHPAPGAVLAGLGLGIPGIVVGLSLASVSDKLILQINNR